MLYAVVIVSAGWKGMERNQGGLIVLETTAEGRPQKEAFQLVTREFVLQCMDVCREGLSRKSIHLVRRCCRPLMRAVRRQRARRVARCLYISGRAGALMCGTWVREDGPVK